MDGDRRECELRRRLVDQLELLHHVAVRVVLDLARAGRTAARGELALRGRRRGDEAPIRRGRTRREIIALKRKLPVFRGSGAAKPDLSEAEAVRLTEALPAPTFDADRRLRELDELA